MTKYFCDACKTTETTRPKQVLVYTRELGESIRWDICDKCIEQIKQLLGNGEKIKPIKINS